jgi:hypothetical protein
MNSLFRRRSWRRLRPRDRRYFYLEVAIERRKERRRKAKKERREALKTMPE